MTEDSKLLECDASDTNFGNSEEVAKAWNSGMPG